MQNNGTTRAAIALIGAGLVMAGIAVGAYSEKVELTKKFNVELDKAVEDVKRTYRDTYFKEAAQAADRIVEEKMTHISSLIEVLQKEGYTVTPNVEKKDEAPTEELPQASPESEKNDVPSFGWANSGHEGTPQLVNESQALGGAYSVERLRWYHENHFYVDEYDQVLQPTDVYESMFKPWVLDWMGHGLYEKDNHIYVSNDRDMTVYEVIRMNGAYDPEEDESDVS